MLVSINYQWKEEVVGGVIESFSEVQINHEFLFESFPILYVLDKHLHYNELCKKQGWRGTEERELVSSAVAWETDREHSTPVSRQTLQTTQKLAGCLTQAPNYIFAKTSLSSITIA